MAAEFKFYSKQLDESCTFVQKNINKLLFSCLIVYDIKRARNRNQFF